MNITDFSRGLAALIFADGFTLPDGVQAVGDFGLPNDGITEAVWNAVTWTGGSAKPSYADITTSATNEELKGTRLHVAALLKLECRRRITASYGKKTIEDEMLLRLRSGQTTAQDTERDRLRSKCKMLVTSLDNLTSNQLEVFNPKSDSIWL